MSFTTLEVVLSLSLVVSIGAHCLAWSWYRVACNRGRKTFQEISRDIDDMMRRLDESKRKREAKK